MRKLLGLALFFVGIGIWLLLFLIAAFWLIPTMCLVFLAGYLTKTHEWPEMKRWAGWNWVRESYFGMQIVHNDAGDALKKGNVIYAIYPHGHFSLTAVFYFALNPSFEHAKGAIHSLIFYLPIFGSIARWLGCIPVSEEAMVTTLKSGSSIFMCPGGVQEIEKTGLDVVRRRGFLRVARKAGSVVVPIWCPEERSYYSQYLPLGRTLSNVLFFPIPLILYGVWWCPLLPRSRQVSRILVGKPILPDNDNMEDAFYTELVRLQALKLKNSPNLEASR